MSHRLALKTSAPFWLPLTLVASGIYLSLSQMVVAAESGSTLPVYGHQVTLEGTPTITAGDTDITVSALPAVKDADNDAHIGWSYVWEVDGAGTEQTTNNPTTIPAYTPSAGMEGKQLQLKVKGLTEARSFPSETAISGVAASNILKIPFSTTAIPRQGSWLRVDTEAYGSKTINGNTFRVTGSASPAKYFNDQTICSGYPHFSASYGFQGNATFTFDKPVTNVKLRVIGMDSSETMTISTNNAATVLRAFPGTSGWNVAASPNTSVDCSPPIISGNAITGNSNVASGSAYLNIGSRNEYYTNLSVTMTAQPSKPGNVEKWNGFYYWISYDHVSIKQ